jgi:UPF0755 protein
MKINKGNMAFALAAALSLGVVHYYSLLYTPASYEGVSGGAGGGGGDGELRTVTVNKGASFRLIAKKLERAGVITSSRGFTLAAALKGAHKKIQAGEYELSRSMTPVEILERLVEGRTKQYLVTFPEGYNLKEIAATLDNAGLADRALFRARAMDKNFAAALGVPGPSLEGYLFPDTYNFTKTMTVDEIIRKMVARFNSVYNEGLGDQARKKGLKKSEVVTIASIVEKEAGGLEEMALISAVFHNRLKRGYRLMSDPTVIYGIKDFDGNITRRDLDRRTPYNTYINYGLPPGPVASPAAPPSTPRLTPRMSRTSTSSLVTTAPTTSPGPLESTTGP